MLPAPLASLLLVLLAVSRSDALPLPGLPLDTPAAPPSAFDPLYLSLVPSASAIQSPSEPPPRQAAVAPTPLAAAEDIVSVSQAPIAVTTVYETRAVTMTVSMPLVQQQQVQQVPSVLPVVPSPSPSSSAAPIATSTIPLTSAMATPPPSPSIFVVTQTSTVTVPPPAATTTTSAPVITQDYTPTNPQLTPVFPTTTWALPPTYSDLSSFKIKKFAVGKENFQVVQGIPAWASAGYVPPPAEATPTPDAPAADPATPAVPTDPSTPTGGLLDGLLGAIGRRRMHARSLQPIVARAPGAIPGLTPNPGMPSLAWDNATSSALQVLFPAGSSNPSSTPVGGGDFYAQPYDMSSASNMTLEYSVFFPVGFDFVKGGKLPGLYGGKEGCSGGDAATDCWSSRMMWRKGGKGEIYLYVPKDKQTPRLCSTPPQSVCDSTYGLSIGRGAFTFKTGGWTTVRQDIWMNTPGLNDGGFNIFIDGQFVFSASDVLYRQAPAPIDPAPAAVDPAAAPAATPDADVTASDPADGSLSKRYDDGMYHPTGDDGQYHPGVIHQADVQTDSVASATAADVEPSSSDEEPSAGAESTTTMPQWEADLEEDPQSDGDVQAASSPAPSSTEESQPETPVWTPTDQEIPPPPAASPTAESYSAPPAEEEYTPTPASDPSTLSDDPESETDQSADAEYVPLPSAPFTIEASVPITTAYYPSSDDQADADAVSTTDAPAAPSPYVDPSPCPTPSSSAPPTATPTPIPVPASAPRPFSASVAPTPVSAASSPSESGLALASVDDELPPPPPPATDDPEQSPSSEPVPTPGINTDGPMLGFTGIFFSTFFGGHGADWASPADQDVWFTGFTVRTNA